MRTILVALLTFMTANCVSAQNEEKILHEILNDLFEFNSYQDTILIESSISKTYFEYDSTSFAEEIGLTIPQKIFNEWKVNANTANFSSEWRESELNKNDTLFFRGDTIIAKDPIIKCLSNEEVKLLREKIKRSLKIYSISKIVLDDSKENGIFHLTVASWPGQFFDETIFINKIYGKWFILSRFGQGIT
jgi:hypothetical protein